ncbi:hypothetical protein Golomagni_05252 [Golovinomyces magnicellulatus]|nr:hypothetical protein Golomagni_05252 [Golovinomyces magnicellulatus]
MSNVYWHIIQDAEKRQAQDDSVVHHVARVETTRSEAIRKDDWHRKVQKEKHALGVSQNISFIPASLVMFYDHAKVKLKPHELYRGPFVVARFAGKQKKSMGRKKNTPTMGINLDPLDFVKDT